MRKLITIATVSALLVTGAVALAGLADASITTPGSNAVLRGNQTLTDSPGASTSSLCAVGNTARTTINLINSSNQTVFTQNVGSSTFGGSQTLPLTTSIDTHNYANGHYTVQGIESSYSGGTLGFGCKNSVSTSNVPVTIDNITSIAYSGGTSAAQGTSVTVSATLTDPNLASSVLPSKTLTFSLSGGGSVNASTDANGFATASLLITGPPRSATLTVSFAGTPFYDANSKAVAFTVGRDTSSTTVTPPPGSVHGQATSFTATVAQTQGSGLTPTGSVQFYVDNNPLGGPQPLSGGVAASPSTSTLGTGAHTVTASYGGDGNFLASDSSGAVDVISKASTATSIQANPPSSVHGQGITFTASVSVTGLGAGTPSGAVQFDVDGNPFGTAIPLTGTTASLTISSLSTTTHQVTATYDGDPDFAASTSQAVNETVGKAGTTTTLTSTDQNSVYGESVTFSVSVAAALPGAGTPTQTVQFAVDNTPLGDPVALVDGQATSDPTSLLSPGAHTVTVSYSGDDDFNGSNDQLTQSVNPDTTRTSLSSSANPSVTGQPVTFHAAVSAVAPGSGTPTGAVQFFVNGSPVGDPVGLLDGAGDSTAISNLPPGTYSITAQYLGDADFLGSTSAVVSQVVNKAATSTSISSDVNPSVFGQPVTFTASVSVNAPGSGSPTGTVTFTDGTTVIGIAPVGPETGELARVTTRSLSVAPHAIVATYSGDDGFLGSTDSLTQTVQRAQSAVVVGSSANPAASGQPVTFTATVSAVAPGSGTPSGTVVFTVNGAPLGGAATVVNGVATSTTFASLSPGTYTIGASYSGDVDFVGSSAQLDQGTGQNVTKGGTTTAIVSSGSPAAYGSAVTFTATVSGVAPATGRPSGVVDFFEGGQLLGAASLAPASAGASTASFAYANLATGDHTVTATYVGNFNFTDSSSALAQSIGSMPTTVGVTSSVNPTSYEGGTTFTAVVSANSGAPTGSITFTDGATVLGTVPVSVAQGFDQATLAVSTLHAGQHAITATYSGGGPYAGSSASLTQTVARASTQLRAQVIITDQVALDRDGVRLDLALGEASAFLTANGHPVAGQTLVFTTHGLENPSIPVCTAVTDSNGFAHCDVTLNNVDDNLTVIVAAGGYQVTYAGNADYAGSTGQGALDS